MHVVTHLLAGWTLADEARLAGRDRALVTWASVAPDVDGAGMLVDFANRMLGRPDMALYETYHHAAGHCLAAAMVYAVIAWLIAARKLGVAVLAFVSFHLHLVFDVLGSRGSSPIDIWTIPYLFPSHAWTWSWSGQWPLTSWQNTTITMVLLAYALVQAVRRGYSPLILFSARTDARFVEVLRQRWGRIRGR